MHSSDVLKVLSDSASLALFKEVATRNSINSKSLMSQSGLTKKQYYTRVQKLYQQGLIRRKAGSFSLTSFGKVLYDCHLKIDNAVADIYSLKAIDSFKHSGELNKVQRKEK
jgi:predicted transcriptional regulator